MTRRRVALLTAAVVGLSLHPVLSSPASARPDIEAGRAAATGERVEVMSARTEHSQVFAEPSGRMVIETSVVPQRVRRTDGSWSTVDLGLAERADGTVRPGASVADVRFSGGGDAPMVTMVEAGKTFELTWPGTLPEPAVSGDSATYAEVLPGVDLVLRATRTGFTHVLVVKTPEATDAVRAVTLGVGGDASVVRLPDGQLRAIAGGTVLASAPAPVMWDSTAVPAAKAARTAAAEPSAERSTPNGPGDAAVTAPIGTEVTGGGDLRLVPDATLLDAPADRFPLFIDPQWDRKRTAWAYSTNNNVQNDSDRARVGLNPDTGQLQRSYFRFPTTGLAGKYVHSARVQMKVDHTYSCTGSPTTMWFADAIKPDAKGRVPWNTKLNSYLATATSYGNEAGGCHDSPQPDGIVQFKDGNVRSKVQSMADGRAADMTVAFCACNSDRSAESTQNRWKQFFNDQAWLIVEFDSKPGTPTNLKVEPDSNCAAPISTGTLTPRLFAKLPDEDGDQKLTATFEWKQISGAGQVGDTTYPVTTATLTNQSANADSNYVTVSIASGKRYAYRVQTRDPAPYNLTSPWSAWCEFYPDTGAPRAPIITRTSPLPGPGGEVSFLLSTPSLDVTKFRYGWTNPPGNEVPATIRTTADGVQVMSATVKVSTVKYGENPFTAYGIDRTLNIGISTTISVPVTPPSRAVARYGLETYPGVDATAALANANATTSGANPLVPTEMTWSEDARVLGGKTATFTGTTSQGAVATGVALDTTKSFSVAAWAKLTDLTTFSTVIAKDAPSGQSSPFRLRARPLDSGGNAWCFGMAPTTTSVPGTEVCSKTLNTVNQWVHVAGGYDKTEGRIKVWVDGAETSAAFNTPITNDSPVAIGRGFYTGYGLGERFRGSLADVQIFNRLLVVDDFTGRVAVQTDAGEVDEPGILDPIEVGRWTFNGGVTCYAENVPGQCEARGDDSFNRRLNTTLGSVIDYGRQGSSLFLDTTLPDGSTPTPLTKEYGRSQRNVGSDSEPKWQDAPVLRTDQSFSVSAWVDPDDIGTGAHSIVTQDGVDRTPFSLAVRPQTANGVESDYWFFSVLPASGDIAAVVRSEAPINYDSVAGWTHLVAVHDAGRKEIRLYVNGVLQGTVKRNFPAFQANGPLVVGGALFNGLRADRWFGGIDDVHAYQGALSESQVGALFDRESAAAAG